MSVVLVNMPFVALERPSLALGLLASILQRDGIPCTTMHANMLFAERIGVRAYRQSSMCKPQDLLGEWIFSPLLFPELEDKSLAYLDRFVARNPALRKNKPEQLLASFNTVRDRCGAFVDEVARQILESEPKVVGCSSTFTQHIASLALLKRIKELAPDVVTMIGGANCEAEMGRATHANFPWVDYVISGEADTLISPLMRLILKKGAGLETSEVMKGVLCPAHREQGYPDRGHCSGSSISSFDLDSLPRPDFDEYFERLKSLPDVSRYVTPGLPVESSRGCWWGEKKGCVFCGLNGMRKEFRARTPQVVMDEMNAQNSFYGVTRFETTDNIMDMAFHDTFLPMLRDAGKPYSVFYETKSNLERKHVKRLSEAGVIWIQPGIESLDSRVLSLMNKGCKAWQNIRLLKLCRQYGVSVGWNMLCHFPGEDDQWYEEMAEILPLLHHLPVTNSMVKIRYDRFSRYHDSPDQFGLELVPAELYSLVYGLDDAELADLAYFFEDRNQQEINQNPILKALMERDGLRACRNALYDWNVSYLSDTPARLEYEDDGEVVTITDSRPCATAAEHRFTGVTRSAFLLMEDGLGHDRLLSCLAEGGVSSEEVEAALDVLRQSNTVLLSDGVWLSLALSSPLPAMPNKDDFPGGVTLCLDDDKLGVGEARVIEEGA